MSRRTTTMLALWSDRASLREVAHAKDDKVERVYGAIAVENICNIGRETQCDDLVSDISKYSVQNSSAIEANLQTAQTALCELAGSVKSLSWLQVGLVLGRVARRKFDWRKSFSVPGCPS